MNTPDDALLRALLAAPPDEGGRRELLRALLAAPAPAARPLPGPVRLHPVRARPRAARDGLDLLLLRGAQLSALAAVAVCGYWFVDGPVRDWLHYATVGPPRRAQAVARPTPAPPQLAPTRPPQAAEDAGPTAGPSAALYLPLIRAEAEPLEAAPPAPTATADPLAALPPESEVAPVERDPEVAARLFLSDALAGAPGASLSPNWLTIPAIQLDAPVVETYHIDGGWQVAEYAAGYLYGTGVPGEVGNVVIAGHQGLRGAVFQSLGALRPGDEVFVERPGWRFRYRVREQRVIWPTEVEVIQNRFEPVLTLITCTNWDTQRLVVVAELVDGELLGP